MELQNLLNKIESLKQELDSYQPLPSDVQEKLNKKFRLEFNYNSNHIEGNTLTYGETELYLIFDKTTGDHEGREYEEMKGSDVALKLIQEYAADTERPLNETFIKNLNKTILVKPYWVDAITPDGQPTQRQITIGDYKQQPNSVRLQNGEIFHYASPQETPALMNDLVEWYRNETGKQELHPVVIAALLHYRFVRIHPFDDGNGRISRLLMNYVLYANGLPPVIIKSTDKKSYLFALNKADTGDVNAFVEYIGNQLLWSLELTIKAAKEEEIEEHDDVEKEITLWKKEMKKNNPEKVVLKTPEAIQKLFSENWHPFIESFEQKIVSLFGDLFVETEIEGIINNSPTSPVNDSLSYNRPYSNYKLFTKYTDDYINAASLISLRIFLQGFTKNINNPFKLLIELSFVLNQYNYQIKLTTPVYISFNVKTYLYNQIITFEEQQTIIEETTKGVFKYLKETTEN